MKFIKLTNTIGFTRSPANFRRRLTFREGSHEGFTSHTGGMLSMAYIPCDYLVEDVH